MTTSNEHNNAPAVPRVEVCCLKFDTCRNQCVPLVDHLRGQIKELKAAPAVPQEEGRPGIPLRKAYKHLLIVAPAQEVGLTDEALDNLIEDLSEWSRHVVEDTAHQTLEAHVREVLEKNPIIAALRAKGQS